MKKLILISGLLMLLMLASVSAEVIDDFNRADGPIDGTTSNQGYNWSASGSWDLIDSNQLYVRWFDSDAQLEFDYTNGDTLEFDAIFNPDDSLGSHRIYIQDNSQVDKFALYIYTHDSQQDLYYEDYTGSQTLLISELNFSHTYHISFIYTATNTVDMYIDDVLVVDDSYELMDGFGGIHLTTSTMFNFRMDNLETNAVAVACDSTLSNAPCEISGYFNLTGPADIQPEGDDYITMADGAYFNGNFQNITYRNPGAVGNLFNMGSNTDVNDLTINIESGAVVTANAAIFDIHGADTSFHNLVVNTNADVTSNLFKYNPGSQGGLVQGLTVNDWPTGVSIFEMNPEGGDFEFKDLNLLDGSVNHEHFTIFDVGSISFFDSVLTGGMVSACFVFYMSFYWDGYDNYVSWTTPFSGVNTWPDPLNTLISTAEWPDNDWISVSSGSIFDKEATIHFTNNDPADTYDVFNDGVLQTAGVDYTLVTSTSSVLEVVVPGFSNWSYAPYLPPLSVNVVPGDGVVLQKDNAEEQLYTCNATGELWTDWLVDGVGMADPSATYLINPDVFTVGTHNITCNAGDGATEVSDTSTFEVTSINTAPVVDSISPDNVTFSDNETQEFTVIYTDLDGDAIYPEWTFDGDILGSCNITTCVIEGSLYSPGSYVLNYGLSDGIYSDYINADVVITASNTPPTIDSLTPVDAVFTDTQTQVFTAVITDAEGGYSVSWDVDAIPVSGETSENITINGSDYTIGIHQILVNIVDGEFSDAAWVDFEIIESNTPPAIANFYPSGHSTVLDNETLEFFVNYNDSDGDADVYFFVNGTPATLSGPNSIVVNGSEWPVGINYTVLAVVNDSIYSDNISGTFEVVSTAVPVVYSGSSGGSSVAYIVDDEDNVIGMQTNTGIIYFDNKDYLATLTPEDDSALFSLFGNLGGDTPWYVDLWNKIKSLFVRGK